MIKKNALKILLVVGIIFVIFGGAVGGGYLVLDKIIVPKYLSSYGVTNLHELVTMIKTMYGSPKESEFIYNPYSDADKVSAFNTLKNAGFPVNEGLGTIDYNAVAKAEYVLAVPAGTTLQFTDKEIASILDDILKSGAIASNLEAVSSFDTVSMTAKEVVITPKILEGGTVDGLSANISLTLAINTSLVRSEMATKMDVPLFLLNMIVPETLYFTCEFDISKQLSGEYRYSSCVMKINGTTEEQSEVLINLLIDFIFDKKEQMTVEKLTAELGGMVVYGLDLLGTFEFSNKIGANQNQNGLVVYIG